MDVFLNKKGEGWSFYCNENIVNNLQVHLNIFCFVIYSFAFQIRSKPFTCINWFYFDEWNATPPNYVYIWISRLTVAFIFRHSRITWNFVNTSSFSQLNSEVKIKFLNSHQLFYCAVIRISVVKRLLRSFCGTWLFSNNFTLKLSTNECKATLVQDNYENTWRFVVHRSSMKCILRIFLNTQYCPDAHNS